MLFNYVIPPLKAFVFFQWISFVVLYRTTCSSLYFPEALYLWTGIPLAHLYRPCTLFQWVKSHSWCEHQRSSTVTSLGKSYLIIHPACKSNFHVPSLNRNNNYINLYTVSTSYIHTLQGSNMSLLGKVFITYWPVIKFSSSHRFLVLNEVN